jgi:hypothetical protein
MLSVHCIFLTVLFYILIGRKQNSENTDDEDDNNDDDDESDDGVRPYQDPARLNPRGEMVPHIPDNSQHQDASHGREDGSGGCGYRSLNLNEHDFGAEDGALDIWSTRNEVDSLDSLSSGHQFYRNVYPTHSTSSGGTGFQTVQVSELRTSSMFPREQNKKSNNKANKT